MTLGLYLAQRLLATFGLISAVFLGVLYLFEVVEMVRRFGGETEMAEVLWIAALRVPRAFYQILPLLMILTSMGLFLGLARSSELIVVRSAGRSALRMLVEPLAATLLFGMLIVALLNPLTTAATRAFQDRVQVLENPGTVAQISVTESGIWLRQGDGDGQTVIRAESAEDDGLTFRDMSFLAFDRETGRPVTRIEAQTGRLVPGAWQLSGAKRWDLDADNPEREAQVLDRLDLPTDLTAARIRDSFARAGTISVWAMPAFIRALDRAGLATRDRQAQFHAELALPLTLAAMMLVGAVLCMKHIRAGSMGPRILATVLAGFALFFLRNFAQVLGENGHVPLILAIWTPPLASMLLAVGILLHLEDG